MESAYQFDILSNIKNNKKRQYQDIEINILFNEKFTISQELNELINKKERKYKKNKREKSKKRKYSSI